MITLRDCSSHNDYSQELPCFNQKRLEKCSTEKSQPYQPKPVVVETVDPNRTRPKLLKFGLNYFLEVKNIFDYPGHLVPII